MPRARPLAPRGKQRFRYQGENSMRYHSDTHPYLK